MLLSDQPGFDFTTLADFSVQLLAVAYGVFATATDFKESAADGKKYLARAGKIGIAFLIVISISGIGIKIYQHSEDSKAKAAAQAAQQKIVRDLQESLAKSKAMSNVLAEADAKLTSQADTLKQQTVKMSDLMAGSQRIIQATSRVLDPLDDSFFVYVRESLKRSEPALQPYLRRIGSPGVSYSEPKDKDWPQKEGDGPFGSYANWRDIDVRIYPMSKLRQVVYPKRGKGVDEYNDYQLHSEVVCTTPDRSPSSSVSVHVWSDNVILECRVRDVNWRRRGDVRSYVDLRNSFLIVSPSTIVGTGPSGVGEYAPPLYDLDFSISGKNHLFDGETFFTFPCPADNKMTCYISHMPSD